MSRSRILRRLPTPGPTKLYRDWTFPCTRGTTAAGEWNGSVPTSKRSGLRRGHAVTPESQPEAHDRMNLIERATILVIDDDVELTEMMVEYLESDGFEIEARHDGDSGLKKALQADCLLVILDVMLPRLNGFEVLRRLRAAGSRIPVLMLTARGDAVDRIVGLQAGADDYLPKPFDPQELVARVQAILRRTAPNAGDSKDVLRVADIVLDSRARTVRRDGSQVELTALEFNLLRVFLQYAGQVISREELFRKVLDREFTVFDRSIDNHVSSLRKKLGPQSNGRERIRAIRNAGYIYPGSEADPNNA
jgi:two-component system response regulator CpxR